jgi:hypothetical protein
MNCKTHAGPTGRGTRCIIFSLALLQAIAPVTSEAEDIRSILDSGHYVPPGKTLEEYEGETYCAGFISAAYSDIFLKGLPADSVGVSGNAWDFPQRIRSMGGYTAPAIQESLHALLPGDIIGIRYRFTRFLQEESIHGFTHVALVLDTQNTLDPIILHIWHIPPNLQDRQNQRQAIRVEFLSELESLFPDIFEPYIIMRPSIP